MNRRRRTAITMGMVQAALLIWAVAPSTAASTESITPRTPIRHFIVLMQENHSFDNYFGTYPGADGPPPGTCIPVDPSKGPEPCVKPFHIGDRPIVDLDHSESTGFLSANGGRMDGFVKAQSILGWPGDLAMGYYDRRDLPLHWNIADRYVLFDRFFTSTRGGSYANHVYWVAGGPGNSTGSVPPEGLRVTTIFDRLEEAGVSWKFYVENYDPAINYRTMRALENPNRASQAVWVPLLTIPRFIDDAELSSHIVDSSEYFADLLDGTLPEVAYMVPSGRSEHPPGSLIAGQRFIRGLLTALMSSSSWDSSAFMYTYDDWGGWYDHVLPPRRDAYGNGFRAPALLVSPYARRHFIDHTTLDFTSMLKFIEENWSLRPLGRLDATAGSIMGAFDFSQPPREAAIIPFIQGGPPAPPKHVRDTLLYSLYVAAGLVALALVLWALLHPPRGQRARWVWSRIAVAARRTTSLLTMVGCLAVFLPLLLAAGVEPAHAAQRPTNLSVQVAPGIKGVRVSLDGRTVLTDAKGFVSISTFSGEHRIRVRPPRSLPDGVTLRFAGWLDRFPKPERLVTLSPDADSESVGFIVSKPISIRVTDPGGQEVPSSLITRITLGSHVGERFTFPPGKPPAAFEANRVVRTQADLVSVPIRYSAREVIMDGANVVYGGSQSFQVGSSTTWTIEALLFPLRIEVRDALFGFLVGDAVRLTLPDGSKRVVDLGSDNAVRVVNLPRGPYELVARGPGIGLTSPASLSSPQTAKLLLLTWVDIAAVIAFAAAFLIGLPILGGRIVRRSSGTRLPTWRGGGAEDPFSQQSEPRPSFVFTAREVRLLPSLERLTMRSSPPPGSSSDRREAGAMDRPAAGAGKTPGGGQGRGESHSTPPQRVKAAEQTAKRK